LEKGDLDRVHELVTKKADGKLTPREKHDAENYRRVSFVLDLLHFKARRSLNKHQKVH
jgi:hypothetical protein